MWFDAKAVLAELEEPAQPAAPAPIDYPKIERGSAAPRVNKPEHLPGAPPKCNVCGKSDWTVAVTLPDGRKLHVICGGKTLIPT